MPILNYYEHRVIVLAQLFYVLTLLVLSPSNTIGQRDTVFVGSIGVKFLFEGMHRVDSAKRLDMEKSCQSYIDNIDILDKYYSLIENGESAKAALLKKKDSVLNSLTSAPGPESNGVPYLVARMKKIGVLWKPTFKPDCVEARGVLFFCTPEQWDYFYKDTKKVRTFHCRYYGSLILNGMSVYELVSFEE